MSVVITSITVPVAMFGKEDTRFIVQDDDRLLAVARYIEANPVRAGLSESAPEKSGVLLPWLEVVSLFIRPETACLTSTVIPTIISE
jgi:hypothetical protein